MLISNCSNFRSRDSTGTESPDSAASIKRVPLAELPIKTPSPFSLNGVKSVNSGFSCISHGLNDLSSARRHGVSMDLSDPFITPIKQTEFSSGNQSLLMPSLLDDDFDESILREIDAICEKSAAKAEMEGQNNRFYEENQHNNGSSSNFKSGSEPVTTNENLRMDSALDMCDDKKSSAEEMDTFEIIQTGSMPDEYIKYLQSLNDKQREAACSDISTPLLIVAGPGSGKVSLMPSFALSHDFLLKFVIKFHFIYSMVKSEISFCL